MQLENIKRYPLLFINNGTKCDAYHGPCNCGAWHGVELFLTNTKDEVYRAYIWYLKEKDK